MRSCYETAECSSSSVVRSSCGNGTRKLRKCDFLQEFHIGNLKCRVATTHLSSLTKLIVVWMPSQFWTSGKLTVLAALKRPRASRTSLKWRRTISYQGGYPHSELSSMRMGRLSDTWDHPSLKGEQPLLATLLSVLSYYT